MTDTQIFSFLVMPFLFILSCSMVFVSSKRMKLEKRSDPPKSATKPTSYTREPSKKPTSAKKTDAVQD